MHQAAQHHCREYEQAMYQHAHQMNVAVRGSIREGLRDDVTNKINVLSATMTIDALLLTGALTLIGADYIPGEGYYEGARAAAAQGGSAVCVWLCHLELIMVAIGIASGCLFASLWCAFVAVRRVTRFKIVTRGA
jgi:hypothetical protein